MPPHRRTPATFVERYGLWTDEQARRAKAVEQAIKKSKLELVRFSFADQHGVLRGKTVVAADAPAMLHSGVTMTTTLLAKDTAHKTVYPVFTAGGGFAMEEMQGGGDFVMVADPGTFQILPWAPNTGWLLCDIYFTNGKPVPFSTRQILRDALTRLDGEGFNFLVGLEVEFHLFKLENPRLAPADATWPPQAPEVSLLNRGYQYLTETRFDQIDAALEPIRRGVEALGMPLRSLEVELGPSQCEFTFRPQLGMAAADTMILFRAAAKQIARRNGCLVSFMCRPGLPNLFSSGWHLHQSLLAGKRRANAFAGNARDGLTAIGLHYLGGLLAHAHAAAAFTTPTVNGYKRIWKTGSASPPPIRISISPRRFTPASMASPNAATRVPPPTRRMRPRRRRCRKISARRSRRCGQARSSTRLSATALSTILPRSKKRNSRALRPRATTRPT
jgi:glutamine synthetase